MWKNETYGLGFSGALLHMCEERGGNAQEKGFHNFCDSNLAILM